MGTIQSSVGLASGIDTKALIDGLINAESGGVVRLQSRLKNVQSSQAGLAELQASLLTFGGNVQRLTENSTFNRVNVLNTDTTQLNIRASTTAIPGTYTFQALRNATAQQSLSRGFLNASTQTVGVAGSFEIQQGGFVERPTSLDLLNGGAGIRRGTIRITDRAGQSADIDLRNAVTVGDVVKAINDQTTAKVTARVSGTGIELRDSSGSTSANLTVTDVAGGRAAADLGIAGSVSANTLTGSSVFRLTSDFGLDQIADGNRLRFKSGQDALQFNLRDGSQLKIKLDDVTTLGDLVQKIQTATGNTGQLTATIQDRGLVLTDTTTGAGTFSVSNLNGSNATRVLGIDVAASGGVLTSRNLVADLGSVQLGNLRGGQGIATLGSINVTDRAGRTATLDLSTADSLTDVINAINDATTSGGQKLSLSARIDDRGNGIVITDSTTSPTGNLQISDVAGGTVAQNLGIVFNSAANTVASGNLGLRRVNEATSLSNYNPRGGGVGPGTLSIKDSTGATTLVNVTSSAVTVGDVLDVINAAGTGKFTAELNSTGDGFTVVDQAGGSGALEITNAAGTTATDLRLTGTAVTGGDGKSRVNSRQVTTISVAATDTLTSLSAKINDAGVSVRSTVTNTGSSLNPYRLSISSRQLGADQRFIIQDNGLNLGFTTQQTGQDAALRIGSDPATAFIKTSNSNFFNEAITGVDVTVIKPSTSTNTVEVVTDSGPIESTLQDFVKNYNAFVDSVSKNTQFDASTNKRAALQGDGTVIRIQSQISGLFTRQGGASTNEVRTLADLGLTLNSKGKLTFDSLRFAAAYRDQPSEITDLFSNKDTGIATRLKKTLDGLNDQNTGSLTAVTDSFEKTASDIQEQIDRLTAGLAARRTQLQQQFTNMERIISGLQSQNAGLQSLSQLASSLKGSN